MKYEPSVNGDNNRHLYRVFYINERGIIDMKNLDTDTQLHDFKLNGYEILYTFVDLGIKYGWFSKA